MLNQRVVGSILLFGQVLDLLGGLYLAYDLFGGTKGPLRRLTEIITYIAAALAVYGSGVAAIFSLISIYNPRLIATFGFGAALGGAVGLAAGGGIGGGFGYAYNLKYQRRYIMRSSRQRMIYAVVVGLVTGLTGYGFFGLAAMLEADHLAPGQTVVIAFVFSLANGVLFASMLARLLVRRLSEAEQGQKPPFDRVGFLAGVVTGALVGIIIAVGYWLIYTPSVLTVILLATGGAVVAALGVGLFLGGVQGLEWRIGRFSSGGRRLGIFGASLVLIGFGLQSLQYYLMIFAIQLR